MIVLESFGEADDRPHSLLDGSENVMFMTVLVMSGGGSGPGLIDILADGHIILALEDIRT